MAKTIKFNLICDEKPVRTIEDLQNNFSVEDILAYYDNMLLHRWLEVRGYNKELEAVYAITSKNPMEIIKELIKIFNVDTNERQIEESVYMIQYLNERRERYLIYEKENYKVSCVIEEYKNGYQKLVDTILENPNDAAIIKASIADMVNNYSWVLKLDHRELFQRFQKKSKLAVMCLLMNEKSRDYYIPTKIMRDDGSFVLDTMDNNDKNFMYSAICAMIGRDDFVNELGNNLISFSGVTDGYWKDLEPKGKKYMIISMDAGDFVRSAGLSGGDLGSTDIINKFIIVDGIDYKSNSNTHKLLYMEV